MSRNTKTQAVAELAQQFTNSSGAVLTEYRGLSVAQLSELRSALRGSAEYTVVKNTLTKIAARDAGVEGFEELLTGPSAIAFVTGDVVEAAKGLKNFGKDHPALVVKGGFLDGKVVTPHEIGQLADLESRDVLLAKLAGGMKASLAQAAALFQAPLSQAARTMEALRVKAEADPSVLAAGAAPQPAAESETDSDSSAADAEAAGPEATPETSTADSAAVDAEAPAEAPADAAPAAEASQEG